MKSFGTQQDLGTTGSLAGSALQCVNCGQPFPILGSHVKGWRASTGRLFCSEFCAEGDEASPPSIPRTM